MSVQHRLEAVQLQAIFKRAMAVSVPAHMSIGSVASQMVSMRITATVLEEKLA
ncbi:hypothetical protein KAM380_058010 [Aeromonas caviae]|nr:hypothetical protein KAM380_058010 [Aeromonas caviae]